MPIIELQGFLEEQTDSGSFRVPTRLNVLLHQALEAGLDFPERGRKDLAFMLAIALRGQLPPERLLLCEQLRDVAEVPPH